MVRNLNAFQRGTADREGIRQRVEALLAGTPELLRGFRSFLPEDAAPAAPIGRGGGKTFEDAITLDSDEEAVVPEAAEDEEVQIVGNTGSNPLSDFPHPRHACVVHPFPPGGGRDVDRPAAEVHCPRCFCFLCDGPAAECASWRERDGANARAGWPCGRASARPPSPRRRRGAPRSASSAPGAEARATAKNRRSC
ncbi:hypothetical protein JL720_7590 [Aureococcus anophagefferens]|nr:hypothetical protein JL720_7590 [Aureococcus anophagefferens]